MLLRTLFNEGKKKNSSIAPNFILPFPNYKCNCACDLVDWNMVCLKQRRLLHVSFGKWSDILPRALIKGGEMRAWSPVCHMTLLSALNYHVLFHWGDFGLKHNFLNWYTCTGFWYYLVELHFWGIHKSKLVFGILRSLAWHLQLLCTTFLQIGIRWKPLW